MRHRISAIALTALVYAIAGDSPAHANDHLSIQQNGQYQDVALNTNGHAEGHIRTENIHFHTYRDSENNLHIVLDRRNDPVIGSLLDDTPNDLIVENHGTTTIPNADGDDTKNIVVAYNR